MDPHLNKETEGSYQLAGLQPNPRASSLLRRLRKSQPTPSGFVPTTSAALRGVAANCPSRRDSLLGRRSLVTAGRPALPPAPSHADLLGEFFADNSLLLQRHPHHSLIYHPELLPSLNFSLSKTLLFTCLILSFKVYVSREVVLSPSVFSF